MKINEILIDGRTMLVQMDSRGATYKAYKEIESERDGIYNGIALQMAKDAGCDDLKGFIEAVASSLQAYEAKEDEPLTTIRDLIGGFIGKKVVDISQHDEDEWIAGEPPYITLIFEDFTMLKFLAPIEVHYRGIEDKEDQVLAVDCNCPACLEEENDD